MRNPATLTTLLGLLLGSLGVSDGGLNQNVHAIIAGGMALITVAHGLFLHLEHRTTTAATVAAVQAKAASGANFSQELRDVGETLLTHFHNSPHSAVLTGIQTGVAVHAGRPQVTLSPPVEIPVESSPTAPAAAAGTPSAPAHV